MDRQISEIAFFTDNVTEMTAYYTKFLKSEPVHSSPDMAVFMAGGTKIFIHKNYDPGEGDLPPENHLAFTVDDLEASCAELATEGLTVEVAPKEYYWGRSAYLRDPDGLLLELTEPAS